MKNNFKIRIMAVILCMVMLFSVSCKTKPITSDGTALDTESETSSTDADAPESDEPIEPTPQEPEFPENGVHKIVTQAKNIYFESSTPKALEFAYYDEIPEILLVGIPLFSEFFFPMLDDLGDFKIEETDTTVTITRDNGAYCVLDFCEDTVYFNNFTLFFAKYSNNIADRLGSTYMDSDGNPIYFSRVDSVNIEALPLTINLAERKIPLDIYEGKKYIPLQTFGDLFFSIYSVNFLYNGKDVFVSTNGSISSDFLDKYYSASKTERSPAFAEYTFNELCLVLDLFYGLREEHGIDSGFKDFFVRTGLIDDLLSADPSVASIAIANLVYGYLADIHSLFSLTSPYTGSSSIDKSQIKPAASYVHYFEQYTGFVKTKAEMLPDVPGYQEIGNTAYISFDSFTISNARLQPYSDESYNQNDTFGLIIYAHSMIQREDSPIENVVLDLSCNMGGVVDAAVYVVAWMLGYCDFKTTNSTTNSYSTCTFKADVNLDGKFDENDSIADKNLYCIISPSSFSCANIVPAYLKESGKVVLIGNISSGGTCEVQYVSTADGNVFGISGAYLFSAIRNGAYHTVENGIEPHFYLSKIESYFKRDELTEYINSLK